MSKKRIVRIKKAWTEKRGAYIVLCGLIEDPDRGFYEEMGPIISTPIVKVCGRTIETRNTVYIVEDWAE